MNAPILTRNEADLLRVVICSTAEAHGVECAHVSRHTTWVSIQGLSERGQPEVVCFLADVASGLAAIFEDDYEGIEDAKGRFIDAGGVRLSRVLSALRTCSHVSQGLTWSF